MTTKVLYLQDNFNQPTNQQGTANEAQLYREKPEFTTKIESSSLIEAVPSESGSKHMGQASMIMAADKQQGINSLEPK